MFCMFYEDLVKSHLQEDTLKKIENSSEVRKAIFIWLTVGVNVVSLDAYQDVAAWLLTAPEDKLKALTVRDVVEGAGEYIDGSGYLV